MLLSMLEFCSTTSTTEPSASRYTGLPTVPFVGAGAEMSCLMWSYMSGGGRWSYAPFKPCFIATRYGVGGNMSATPLMVHLMWPLILFWVLRRSSMRPALAGLGSASWGGPKRALLCSTRIVVSFHAGPAGGIVGGSLRGSLSL